MAKKNRKDEDEWNTGDNDFEYGTGEYSEQKGLLDDHLIDEEPSREGEEPSELDEREEKKFEVTELPEEEKKPKKRAPNMKPKLVGKHSLAFDTIFKGKRDSDKKENPIDQDSEYIIKYASGSFNLSESSIEHEESHNSIDAQRALKLKQEIYNALKNNTDINFLATRRRPAKSDFNAYFIMLMKALHEFGYTKTEIFIELSGYFSDNVWNIFKLLDNEWRDQIIHELIEKYGISGINKIDFLE